MERANNAVAGAARVVVNRLPGADHLHKRIIAAQNQARQVLHGMSMPYGDDDGWRLLPNANFEAFVARMHPIHGEINAAKEELKAQAPAIIAQAKSNLGSLDVPVPTEDELVAAYAIKLEFRDIHEGSFKGLPPQVQATLRKRASRDIEAAVKGAISDTMGRFVQPLSYFVERMRLFDERERAIANGQDVGRTGVFRDSVVENIKELAEIVGTLNVTGDPRLEKLATDVQALVIEPDALRDSQPKREEAVKVASNILADLNDWLT